MTEIWQNQEYNLALSDPSLNTNPYPPARVKQEFFVFF